MDGQTDRQAPEVGEKRKRDPAEEAKNKVGELIAHFERECHKLYGEFERGVREIRGNVDWQPNSLDIDEWTESLKTKDSPVLAGKLKTAREEDARMQKIRGHVEGTLGGDVGYTGAMQAIRSLQDNLTARRHQLSNL